MATSLPFAAVVLQILSAQPAVGPGAPVAPRVGSAHPMKLHGTVRYRDLEGGLWVFESDDGMTYQLAGGDRKLKRDGARATLEGDVLSDAVTLGMVGPVLKVTSYRFD